MPSSIGFWYERDGYDTSGKRLLGRQSAGESFLRALVQHSRAEKLFCIAPSEAHYKDCVRRISSWTTSRNVAFVPADNPLQIGQAEVLYRPDPVLANVAWMRRSVGQRLFSLCGVTHTICTKETMQNMGQLAISPLQPWDAVICTSTAVKTSLEGILANWTDYLASRCGGRPTATVQFPVIPLGIESASLAPSQDSAALRNGLRKTLEIGAQDVAVLYVGRLNFYAKAHPIPMYLALERAAQATGKKLHLLQVGWFEQERDETAFKVAAQKFCPSVPCAFLDGRRPEIRRQAWAAGDLFISLSDNIQETFGLTPLEAMAAGLPVICTDWDGYQDTVRHEVDGFRVPVVMPPPGSGTHLAKNYLSNQLKYNAYIGRAAQSTAADIDVVTHCLVTLIQHPELRAKMGAAGQQRARSEFDWSVIIGRYESLWDELAKVRRSGPEVCPPSTSEPFHPLCDDPFRVFAGYTERHLDPQDILTLGSCGTVEIVKALVEDWMSAFGSDDRLSRPELAKILNHLKVTGPTRLGDFLSQYRGHETALYLTVGWLLKFGVVRVIANNI